ncbi:hypothetical protein CKO28_24355 [Rhodovibrio sodomensis]|uniref:DUF1465 domain-containing protein n=1 Tax=Rhodovibrio sodomensis TaxID=1088 RepID=A0ABS1DM99_9PROT|nr:hypothetical protein [Rhodovibrio sodomensis]MBK1671141.1 hypothetical protein [Rhodovibrio sodomensis]
MSQGLSRATYGGDSTVVSMQADQRKLLLDEAYALLAEARSLIAAGVGRPAVDPVLTLEIAHEEGRLTSLVLSCVAWIVGLRPDGREPPATRLARDPGLGAPKSRVATEVPALADTLARATAFHARLLRVQDNLDRLPKRPGDPAAACDPLTGSTPRGIGSAGPPSPEPVSRGND